jgi:serine/threonine-protein kinase HipA
VGLTTVEARCETLGARDALIVSRFDREEADGVIRRLHQEDLLQALGIDPLANRGRAKYQAVGTPGPPSWWHAADLLDTYAEDPSSALLDLVRAVTFTSAISNADCHAKNLSFLLEDGHIALAPLYDTVPTGLWTNLRSDAAMTVNDVGPLSDITIDDIVAETRRWRVPEDQARRTATELLDALHAAVRSCEHPDVAGLVASNAERLLS